jgi:hypothetical protein
MKTKEEIYKEWSGIEPVYNSCLNVHDSTQTIEFAEYYFKARIEELRKDAVISRRELLIAFHDSLIGEIMPINKFHSHRNVDSFLASNVSQVALLVTLTDKLK